MNYQLTEEMEEYWHNTQRMLFFLPLVGNGFKKKYYDVSKDRVCDEHIFPTDIYVNAMANSIAEADRVTHCLRRTPVQMRLAIQKGEYDIDIDRLGAPVMPHVSDL